MAMTAISCIVIVAMCITLSTQQGFQRSRFDRPRYHRHGFGPCRLTDGADNELESNDCPMGRTCTVGPVELHSGGVTTIKAYFCTPSALLPRCGPCRIERDGVVVEEETTCPHGNACDVGPHDYRDGDLIFSAFYCRRNPGAHLCGVTSPDGKIAGGRSCSEGLVCDLDFPMNTFDNNYSIYACRRPLPPKEVCRVEMADGTTIDEQTCSDGSPCEQEGFPFENDGETFVNFYCPRNDDDYNWMMSHCGGRGGCCGGSGSGSGCPGMMNGRQSRGRFHHGHMGRSMGRNQGGRYHGGRYQGGQSGQGGQGGRRGRNGRGYFNNQG